MPPRNRMSVIDSIELCAALDFTMQKLPSSMKQLTVARKILLTLFVPFIVGYLLWTVKVEGRSFTTSGGHVGTEIHQLYDFVWLRWFCGGAVFAFLWWLWGDRSTSEELPPRLP